MPAEASLIEELEMYPIPSLLVLMDHVIGHTCLSPFQCDYSLEEAEDLPPYAADLGEIRGQEHVKRALEVAAAGPHNMMMVGPPGASKTLIARSMLSILPRLTVNLPKREMCRMLIKKPVQIKK